MLKIIPILFLLLAPNGFASINYCNESHYNNMWALLIAVGLYAGHPEQNRPSMLEALNNIKDALLSSPCWQEDHVRVIKGGNATVKNILRGFLWLMSVSRKNDFSLVYIATHGFPIPVDIPPFDESDGKDEALASYFGFVNPLAILWDDEINFFLSLLESKGVCLIVDSCYSGGFNDAPFFGKMNRVVLMSCKEDEVSYGSVFSNYIAEGLSGKADCNHDKVITAEELFNYARERMEHWLHHPTMCDYYPGDLPVTFLAT